MLIKTEIQQPKYNDLMRSVHWLMAIGLVVALAAGLYMVSINGITPLKLKLYNWHKWLGVTLFMLLIVRAVVRFLSQIPAYPAHWSKQQIVLVKLGHSALYACMLLVPVFGYLFSLAAGFPVVWFGVVELPTLIEKNAELKETFRLLHEVFGKLLMVLIIGHVTMALKHHFVDKDKVLGRMRPM